MTAGDDYRARAAELHAKAKVQINKQRRDELEHLVLSYLRLAEQADRNALTDITYETPPPPLPDQSIHQHQQQQQQQQQQSKPDQESKE